MVATVGIIGAGQMGNGIAHVFAVSGFNVLLNDISQDRLDSGLATINGNLNRQLASGKIDEAAKDAASNRISPTIDLSDLSQADLIIEAATENEAVKLEILKEVGRSLKPRRLLPRIHHLFQSPVWVPLLADPKNLSACIL